LHYDHTKVLIVDFSERKSRAVPLRAA